MMDARPDHRILDVRSEEEYITGHADGAVLLPLDKISEESARAAIPAKDTLLLVYCRSGRRSAQAARLLAQLGYTQVYDMGSLVGWPYGMAW
jgi:rhodanese-related sulfurtransferase